MVCSHCDYNLVDYGLSNALPNLSMILWVSATSSFIVLPCLNLFTVFLFLFLLLIRSWWSQLLRIRQSEFGVSRRQHLVLTCSVFMMDQSLDWVYMLQEITSWVVRLMRYVYAILSICCRRSLRHEMWTNHSSYTATVIINGLFQSLLHLVLVSVSSAIIGHP